MSGKFKVAGLLALGAVAGALTTMQLQAYARGSMAPLPLEELQQLAAVFGHCQPRGPNYRYRCGCKNC